MSDFPNYDQSPVPNYEQFIAMLKARGTFYVLYDLEYCRFIEVGVGPGRMYAYRFNIQGKWAGGWQVGDSPEIREQFIHILHTGSPT